MPTYCRRSCRQRAYEDRHGLHQTSILSSSLDPGAAAALREELSQALDGLRDASRMALTLARGGGWSEGPVESHPAFEILLKGAMTAAEAFTGARDRYLSVLP